MHKNADHTTCLWSLQYYFFCLHLSLDNYVTIAWSNIKTKCYGNLEERGKLIYENVYHTLIRTYKLGYNKCYNLPHDCLTLVINLATSTAKCFSSHPKMGTNQPAFQLQTFTRKAISSESILALALVRPKGIFTSCIFGTLSIP